MEKKYYSNIQPHVKNFPEGSLEEIINNSKMKAYDYLYDKAMIYPHLTAIRFYEEKYSYDYMFKKIKDYAKAFKSYGIKQKDVVSLLLPNIPEMVYIKYALNRIGASSYLIDPRTNPDQILEYFNKSKSSMLISAQEFVPLKVLPIVDKLNCDNIITTSVSDSMNFVKLDNRVKMLYAMMYSNNLLKNTVSKIKGNKFISIQDLEKKYKSKFSGILDTPFEENEPFSIYNTSGTTDPSGTLKGCIASNEAYNATVEQMKFAGKNFTRGESSLAIIPMFSSFGSLASMHNSLSNVWELILLPKFDPLTFNLDLLKHKPNSVIAVPSMWETLLNDCDDTVDYSFLKRPVTGSAKMHISRIEAVNEFFEEHGAVGTKLKVAYGASEFGGCISATLEDHGIYESDTEGMMLLGCRAMVIDPETLEELPIGVAGELCVNTPTMMNGYLDNEKATEDITVYKNDVKYFKTGDKVYLDETGHVHMVDRYKSVIKTPDGHSIPPTPIENAIMLHPKVENCVAVGLSLGNESGGIPTVFVQPKNEEEVFENIVNELNDLCKVSLPEGDMPMAFVKTEGIVLTPMLKPNRKHYEKFKFDEVDAIVTDDYYLKSSSKKYSKNK